MNTSTSVLGVSGVCWVGFEYPPQFKGLNYAALRALCRVCWVCLRARACARYFQWKPVTEKISHAKTNKPNTPNTHYTVLLNLLICMGICCVEFVLGKGFFVSGSVFRGEGR